MIGWLRKMLGGADGQPPVPLSLTNDAAWRDAGLIEGAARRTSQASAMGLSAFWACAQLVAGTISTLPLMLYRRQSGDVSEVARDHPLYRILHDAPNFDQTAVDFIDFLALSVDLHGRGLARKVRDRGRLIGLEPIRADSAMVRRNKDGTIGYEWTQDGRRQTAGEADILHVRGPGGDPLGGMSVLQVARRTMGTAQAAEISAASTFERSMRPSGMISTKEAVSASQYAELRALVEKDFVGAANAGRPFIGHGGMTFTPFSLTPEDSQLLESRSFSVEEICRFWGVPPVMIGHTSKTTSWPQGVEQQVLLFVKFTLRRRLKRIEAAMTQQLLTPAERASGLYVEFNLEGLLRGDSASRTAFYNAGLSGGWLVINEVRRWENLPPVDGGDVPRMQMQNVPITEIGQQENGNG